MTYNARNKVFMGDNMLLKNALKYKYRLLFICCMLCGLLNVFTFWQGDMKYPAQALFIPAVVIVIAIVGFKLYKEEPFDEKTVIFCLFVIGFFFRLVYIQSTGHLIRQHDVGGKNGHLEYILKFYTHQKLPQTIEWQYYQPPVWHYICSLFLHIQTTLGIALDAAKENLQLISFFCSNMITLVSYRLFKKFSLKGLSLIIPFAIVVFHPTFIILAGSINNDVLSLLLALISVDLAIKWYREPKLATILKLALSIGFSMGVKLSGGLISVGVAMLFAIRLFGKKYKNKIGLIGQFASFGIICVPIALWWQVRNYIRFDTPFTYVPKLSETHSQFIGFRSFFERIFDISAVFDIGVYPARMIQSKVGIYDYYEYNIPLGALKSSVFGEYYLGQGSKIGLICAQLLFWSAVIIAIAATVSAVYAVIKAFKNSKEECEFAKSELIFTLVCVATVIFSYIKFCFEFAHFCTMDFRYIAITVVFGALYIGLLLKHREKNNKMFDKILRNSLCVLIGIFALSSLAIYLTAG